MPAYRRIYSIFTGIQTRTMAVTTRRPCSIICINTLGERLQLRLNIIGIIFHLIYL